jgi:cation diffusion facilitator CzcD-associated flavoprotein CzcO
MPVTPGERLVNQPGMVPEQLDAVVVGAGFSGLYLLHRLRQFGFSEGHA